MKKVLSIVLALVLVLGMFSFANAEEKSGKIVVAVYSETGAQEAWDALAAAYMTKNPGVEVVVDLKPQDSYTDWVKALFASVDTEVPEADLVYRNLAGADANNKCINFLHSYRRI